MTSAPAFRPRAGFTLVEVMVALTISAIVVSSVVGVLTLTTGDTRRTRALSQMLRDAESVTHMLNSELRLAGLGVPSGDNIDSSYGTSPPVRFASALLVGGTNEIGILADLPRPDANFSTFGALHSRPTGSSSTTAIAWHNEDNGGCMPDTSTNSCVAGRDSVFFADDAAGCNAVGSGTPFLDRKCPWGLRRLLPGDSLQIVTGDGRWARAVATGSVVTSAAGVYAAELSPGYPRTAWPNAATGDAPAGVPGQGFVTTLDRVFYRLDGTTIVRRQCWGDPNPNDDDWPRASVNSVPANPAATGGNGANDSACTPAEVVARDVSLLRFDYFAANNVPVTIDATTKANVRRVDYVIEFARTVDGRAVLHRVAGSVRLTNIP